MTARILAPRPAPGYFQLRVALAKDSREERVSIHAERPIPPPFSYQGIEISIERLQRVESTKAIPTPPGIEVWVTAARNGQPLAIDGHLRFFPPPLLVPDGTYRLEAQQIGQRVESVEVANYREDPAAALCTVIGQAIAGQLR